MGNNETIKIVYVDDAPEPDLSKYLDSFTHNNCKIAHEDVVFDPDKGYESLINDMRIRTANIILIDSKLFENRSSVAGKFTGEQFKMILRKHFPFIEVIVVTQNDIEEGYNKIPKYKYSPSESSLDYYHRILPEVLNTLIKNILEYRMIAENLQDNKALEQVLVEKIKNSLNGIDLYDELTKTDIDNFVKVFKEVQEALGDN